MNRSQRKRDNIVTYLIYYESENMKDYKQSTSLTFQKIFEAEIKYIIIIKVVIPEQTMVVR